jgi:hypothetical protein
MISGDTGEVPNGFPPRLFSTVVNGMDWRFPLPLLRERHHRGAKMEGLTMKRSVTSKMCTAVTVVLVSCAPWTARAAVNILQAELRAELMKPGNFRSYTTTSAIPSSVRASFAEAARDSAFAMAEPGAKWQATDVPMASGPRRRLEKVALSKSLCIIFYELGGRGWSYNVAIFRFSPDKADLVWHGVFFQKIVSPASLLEEIDKGHELGGQGPL